MDEYNYIKSSTSMTKMQSIVDKLIQITPDLIKYINIYLDITPDNLIKPQKKFAQDILKIDDQVKKKKSM